MNFKTIKTEKKKNLGYIFLNRPTVLNAINEVLLNEVIEAVDMFEADQEVRVLIVKSLCEKAFSSGIDVEYVKDISPFGIRDVGRLLHKCFGRLRQCDKPIIACIDGLCLGAGLELAISCDLLVASNRSKFGLPNINVGIPAIVEAAVLVQAVGIFHTREMCYTGKFWNAEKAYERGLLNRIEAPENLDSSLMELAETIASKSPHALSTQKEIIYKWMTTDLESAIDYSINTVCLNWTTRDQKEGMSAFVDKRKASFTGG